MANSPILSLSELALAADIKVDDIVEWIEMGHLPRLTSRGNFATGVVTIDDAVVLRVASRIMKDLRLPAFAALAHAQEARGWKKGPKLVVALKPQAMRFGVGAFSFHEPHSDSYGGVFRPRDIGSGLFSMHAADLDGYVVNDLSLLEGESLEALKE